MQPRILVTGANGFVGRPVCSELARRGFAVRAAVRDAARGAGLEAEIAPVGSIGPDTDWSAALKDVDAVIHLAARVHVMRETAADPLSEFRALNVAGSETLAHAAAAAGVRRIVYVSSIKVNGEATFVTPFTADDIPRPQDPYGISKWEAEQGLQRIGAATGLEVAIVRPPLVYGPRVGGNFLRLLTLVRRGVPLPLGSVQNRRSMVYSGNLASALAACAIHPQAAGNTYLVSDGEDLSTPALVRQMAVLMGVRAPLWHVPPVVLSGAAALVGKRAEVQRLTGSLTVDGSPLRETLGWTPPFTVAEALTETTRWFCGAKSDA